MVEVEEQRADGSKVIGEVARAFPSTAEAMIVPVVFGIKERGRVVPSILTEAGREVIFVMLGGSDAAVSNASCVGEDLPDNEVALLFSEFLRERIPLRARERGE